MVRLLEAIVFCPSPLPAAADKVLMAYADYESFVDTKMKKPRILERYQPIWGADAYTPQQMQTLQGQLRDLVPYCLTNSDVAKRIELENGFSQEMRIYWNGKNSYLYQ